REPPTGGGWKKRFVEQGMPAALVELLESCIDADPADRPANASVLADRLTALAGAPSASLPIAQVVEAVPPVGAGRESSAATKLKILLVGVGGDRGVDEIPVLFDGRPLGQGCAATGFEFDCDTRPGSHTVELHGHRKKRFLIFGERKVNEFRMVYPLHLPEPGSYAATFRFARFV